MIHMMQRRTTAPTRRPVAGYILASIVVGVLGLVTAIAITISGIMNTFSDVGESYADAFETGEHVGPQATPVELGDAKYTVLSLYYRSEEPSVAEQMQQCDITDPDGDPVASNTSSQQVTEAQAAAAGYHLPGLYHVIFTHFEAREGTYIVECQQEAIVSDGASYRMSNTALQGVLIGLSSVVIAGGLFVMGVVNSSRNKKAQAAELAQAAQPNDNS